MNHGARDSVSVLDPFGRGVLAHALDATRLETTNKADLNTAVKLLIRHGVDINGLCCPRSWLIHASERFFSIWEHSYNSGWLLDGPLSGLYGGQERETALLYTIRRGNNHRSLAHCIEVLFSNGANADVRNKGGTSAFDLAMFFLHDKQRIEVERILCNTRPFSAPRTTISLDG